MALLSGRLGVHGVCAPEHVGEESKSNSEPAKVREAFVKEKECNIVYAITR